MRATVMLSIVALSGCTSGNTLPGRPTPEETVRIVGPGRTIQLTTSPAVAARAAITRPASRAPDLRVSNLLHLQVNATTTGLSFQGARESTRERSGST